MEDSTSCVHNRFVLFVMALRCFLSHEADVGQSMMWVVFIVIVIIFFVIFDGEETVASFIPTTEAL